MIINDYIADRSRRAILPSRRGVGKRAGGGEENMEERNVSGTEGQDKADMETLQLFYAALMVDSAAVFEKLDATERVAEWKAAGQAAAASGQLARLGITTPASLFTRFMEVFGCARWAIEEEDGGTTIATARSCLACGIAKRRGAGKPCELYCINPFRALLAAMTPAARLEVDETLWDGTRCLFRVLRK